jgi:hypothetical protein
MMLNAIELTVLDKRLDPSFVAGHGQIPMGSFFEHRSASRQSRLGFNQFQRTQCASTFLTLIAISSIIAAFGACARDIAIRQKLLGFCIIILLRRLHFKHSLLQQALKDSLTHFMVFLGGSAVINIKLNPKIRKRLVHQMMVMIHNLLGRLSIFAGAQCDGRSVLI